MRWLLNVFTPDHWHDPAQAFTGLEINEAGDRVAPLLRVILVAAVVAGWLRMRRR